VVRLRYTDLTEAVYSALQTPYSWISWAGTLRGGKEEGGNDGEGRKRGREGITLEEMDLHNAWERLTPI